MPASAIAGDVGECPPNACNRMGTLRSGDTEAIGTIFCVETRSSPMVNRMVIARTTAVRFRVMGYPYNYGGAAGV